MIAQNSTEPPTQQEPDHIGATEPQNEVNCDAKTATPQHRPDAGVVPTQTDAVIAQNSTDPPTQQEPDHIGATEPQSEVHCDADADEHEAPELNGPGQEMAYVIVNAFLEHVTLENTEVEKVIKQVILKTGEVIQKNMLLNVDEIFRPIFFYYPNGLGDRTRAEPRNPREYIAKWRDIAGWRLKKGAAAQQSATEQLTKPQVQSIFNDYIKNFISEKANDTQRVQTFTKNKSRAEAVLRKECGSSMMAKLIWKVGLPNVSEATFAMAKFLPATEQQRPLKQDVRQSIATATETILNWLSMLANSIQEHKETPEYQEQKRKSGTQKNKSGLTEIELSAKKELKNAARLKYGHQSSTASGSDTWQPLEQWQWYAYMWQTPAQWQWHSDRSWEVPQYLQHDS